MMLPKNHRHPMLLLISVDRGLAKPLYQQIYEAYRTKIARGDLRGGDRVASTRELARDLGISRLPVLNAYSQLLAEGHFESRVGSGTYISQTIAMPSGSKDPRTGQRDAKSRLLSTRARALPRFERPSRAEHCGAFQVGQPDLKNFPIHIWSRLFARYSRELKVGALQYGHPMGLEELRQALTAYLRASRGVRCEPEQIMIVSGSQQALDISVRVLLDPGAPVWVEEPGYRLAHHVLAGAGCQVIPVPVDSDGLNVPLGIKLLRKARAAIVAPSHQYPLGVTMSATRRFQLLEWARKERSWIIENDYDSEYRYDSMPVGSLQGLDTNARVIYIGTLSKVLFPSVRLGYIVAPSDLTERFAAVRQSMDICPNHANQAVLAAFIREGHFGRHIRKMRRIYEGRRRVLVEHLQCEFASPYMLMGAEAGMHLTLLFGDRIGDSDIVEKGIHRGLWLSALSNSYLTLPRQGLVLGFANTPIRQIPDAVLLLKKILGWE